MAGAGLMHPGNIMLLGLSALALTVACVDQRPEAAMPAAEPKVREIKSNTVWNADFGVLTDPETGCQYLLRAQGITPRMQMNHPGGQRQMGCP